jgi:hypothetical protein
MLEGTVTFTLDLSLILSIVGLALSLIALFSKRRCAHGPPARDGERDTYDDQPH